MDHFFISGGSLYLSFTIARVTVLRKKILSNPRALKGKLHKLLIFYDVNMTTKSKSDGEFSHVSFGEIPYKYGRLLMYIWFKFIGARLSRKSIGRVFPQREKTLICNNKKKPCLYKPCFICV